jgi:hypothetical protein
MIETHLLESLEFEVDVLSEELTDKTVKTSIDKLKVARTIAEILGYTKTEEFTDPSRIINNALKNYKNKVLNGEALNLVHRIVSLAKKAEIDFDETLVPTKVQKVDVAESVTQLMEALTMAGRRKRALKMRMLAPMLTRKRELASHKMASNENLLRRAQRMAHERILQKKFLKNRKYSELSPTEKYKYEKLMQPLEGAVKRLAKKLLPKVRQKEMQRLQHSKVV